VGVAISIALLMVLRVYHKNGLAVIIPRQEDECFKEAVADRKQSDGYPICVFLPCPPTGSVSGVEF
jgi:hypothetical protein